jgi:hypothetical protein
MYDSVSQGLSLHRYSETLVLHLRFVTVDASLSLYERYVLSRNLPGIFSAVAKSKRWLIITPHRSAIQSNMINEC